MIQCDSLVKIYEMEQHKVMALEGLDLMIEDGEMMAIIGKSGSGKSTLLNIIGGLESPTAGILMVDGKDLSSYTEKELVLYRRDKVGFMQFHPGTSAREKRKRARDLLKAVGMEAHAEKFPSQLSGGEQQRIAIAVALSNQPSILLADEPTGAVDTKTANQIFELFHKLNEEFKITIIIVTHDMALADKVERTVLISDGKISTEKIRKVSLEELQRLASAAEFTHEEYSVLDKAHRLQLTEEMLEEAGIDSNKVRIEVQDGKILIQKE